MLYYVIAVAGCGDGWIINHHDSLLVAHSTPLGCKLWLSFTYTYSHTQMYTHSRNIYI